MSHKRSPAARTMGLPASLSLGFPSLQYVLIQLCWKTGAAPRIQAHLQRLGYEICEKWRLWVVMARKSLGWRWQRQSKSSLLVRARAIA